MVGWKDWKVWEVEEGLYVGGLIGFCIKLLNFFLLRKVGDGEIVLVEWDDVG